MPKRAKQEHDETTNSWQQIKDAAILTVKCPFCGQEIVRACDLSMFPVDIDDEERDKFLEGWMDCSYGECEHLAFRSDWAYDGSEVLPRWEKEMNVLAEAICGDPEAGADTLAAAMHVDGVDLDLIAKKVLPNLEFESSYQFVEKFDGPSSGGPTYMHIFLREPANKSTKKISRKRNEIPRQKKLR